MYIYSYIYIIYITRNSNCHQKHVFMCLGECICRSTSYKSYK